jgi:hypothetical protein
MSLEPADRNVCATFKPRGHDGFGNRRQGNAALDEKLLRVKKFRIYFKDSVEDGSKL